MKMQSTQKDWQRVQGKTSRKERILNSWTIKNKGKNIFSLYIIFPFMCIIIICIKKRSITFKFWSVVPGRKCCTLQSVTRAVTFDTYLLILSRDLLHPWKMAIHSLSGLITMDDLVYSKRYNAMYDENRGFSSVLHIFPGWLHDLWITFIFVDFLLIQAWPPQYYCEVCTLATL